MSLILQFEPHLVGLQEVDMLEATPQNTAGWLDTLSRQCTAEAHMQRRAPYSQHAPMLYVQERYD